MARRAILQTIRHVRGGLEAARATGSYTEFHAAAAELRRLADQTPQGTVKGIAAGTGREARALFVELRGVVDRGVRVDARRKALGPLAWPKDA